MSGAHLLRRTFDRIRPHMAPRLLIIGAQKAGTTALFSMLAKHPKAAPPKEKELDFFNDDAAYAKGIGHYRSLFPPIPAKSSGHFTFEASPSYLYHAERCAPRIAKDLPGVLCVAILRDPVKRAYSAWNMRRDFIHHPNRKHLFDPRSFNQAVEDEMAGRISDASLQYLKRGLYSDQLLEYRKHIPLPQIKVFSYNTYRTNPHHVITEICNSLNIAPLPKEHPAFKICAHSRPYTAPIEHSLAKDLYQYYAAEGIKLQKMLGPCFNLIEETI